MRITAILMAILAAVSVGATAVGGARHRCSGHPATIVGTPGDDRLVGTEEQDVIVGLGGDDVLVGRGNLDFLCGGPGADRFEADEDDSIRAGRGRDLVSSGGHVHLGAGDDRASGVSDVRGGRGDDRIEAAGVHANFFGGSGNDVLIGDDASPHDGGDFLSGGSGNDLLDGKALLNRIVPGPGRDVVRMGRHRGSWTGLLSYAGAQGVKVSLRRGTAWGQGRDRLFGVITWIVGSPAPDVLAAADGRQVLDGLAGDDRLFGFGGDDELRGDGGTDAADGGAGSDVCAAETSVRCET